MARDKVTSKVQRWAGLIHRMLTLIRKSSRMMPASVNHNELADRHRLSVAPTCIVAPFASDPESTMRREIKLLRIEVEQLHALEHMLRAENDILRAGNDDDARKAEALLLAYAEQVEQLRESRDYWEGEAKRLNGERPHRRWVRWWRDRSRTLNRFLRTVFARFAQVQSAQSLFAAK